MLNIEWKTCSEKLKTGKWKVYRSAASPLKLVCRFPGHPDIGTLHDNFVYASETFRDYKYLGTRIREDGAIGEYNWTTYGEAAIARSAIAHGIPKMMFVASMYAMRVVQLGHQRRRFFSMET